jgi:hypothetical protein
LKRESIFASDVQQISLHYRIFPPAAFANMPVTITLDETPHLCVLCAFAVKKSPTVNCSHIKHHTLKHHRIHKLILDSFYGSFSEISSVTFALGARTAP